MNIKRAYLIFASVGVGIIALLYGVSPQWFAKSFLGVADLDRNMAHILRAIMGLYMSFAIFWLFAALGNTHRNTAVLTTLIFAAGLVSGRLISLLADGVPSRILVIYTLAELALVPLAYLVYRLPEDRV